MASSGPREPDSGSGRGSEVEKATTSRLVSGLVLDRDLSPRARLGSNHVRQLAEAIKRLV